MRECFGPRAADVHQLIQSFLLLQWKKAAACQKISHFISVIVFKLIQTAALTWSQKTESMLFVNSLPSDSQKYTKSTSETKHSQALQKHQFVQLCTDFLLRR